MNDSDLFDGTIVWTIASSIEGQGDPYEPPKPYRAVIRRKSGIIFAHRFGYKFVDEDNNATAIVLPDEVWATEKEAIAAYCAQCRRAAQMYASIYWRLIETAIRCEGNATLDGMK